MKDHHPSFLQHTKHNSYFTFLLFLSLLVLSHPSQAQQLQTQTFNFGPFDNSYRDKNLTVLKDASIDGGALQLTPDSRNSVSYLQNKSGRILFNRPFRLWENTSNTTHIASFNTSFVVNIFSNTSVLGEGLAFVITPSLDSPPPGSDGGYLGLTNSTIDGNTSNQIVAIELDTSKQWYDPDDNHVGLDVNSVISLKVEPLNGTGIDLSGINAANHTVWIDYNGSSKRISVYMSDTGYPKPRSPVLSDELDLSSVLKQDNYFGFTGSTGDNFELNCVLFWNLTVEIIQIPGTRAWWKLAVGISVPLLAVGVMVVVLGAWFYMRKRKVRDEGVLGSRIKLLPGMPREFEYRELKKATDNFSEKNRLGKGGFGVVYKGRMEIDHDNTYVAVKSFSKESKIDDFFHELAIINRLRHRHLVRLFGWCYRKGKLLLIYEFMPHGSLDWHLYHDSSILSWDRRHTILTGVASALHYLHNEYEQKVIHRDLKPSNILLDAQYYARLGDFGLARAIEADRTSYANIDQSGFGTMGYIAPECYHTGKATCESDIFGFGTVILEVVCCRQPFTEGSRQTLIDWVWMLYGKGQILEAVDKRLDSVYDKSQAERLLMLGLACTHPSSGERPKTEAIVQMISGSVPLPPIPRVKPAFMWPGATLNDGNFPSPAGHAFVDYSYSTFGSSTVSMGQSTGQWTNPSTSELEQV